ncbi:Rid family hydrolase [uncultured Ilyobacter sp.]|uniref:Rid family hydrolase n=1 Tax=uncultured Ilyobacter sp. TaxID=544433 RepID=UPI002AA8921B|nr:Rid family hydrolase [uncultured Ilyobacter sp.]
MEMTRTNYSSGAPLEEKAGYSRMVTVGPFIYLGGTTSVKPDGIVHGENDPYEQAKFIFDKLLKIMEKADAGAENVVKVKAYVTDMSFASEIARAYSEYFKEVKPLFTMVGTTMLNRPTQLVEIEMDAIKY